MVILGVNLTDSQALQGLLSAVPRYVMTKFSSAEILPFIELIL